MSEATWIPIFVTANVPIEVTNSVLEAAATEVFQAGAGDTSERVGNVWVLIQKRDQETFPKPTNPPVAAFESDFIGATPEELQEFVQSRFGDEGVGKGSADSFDYLSGNAFAVIDEHAARDRTLQFWVRALVDGLEEAAINVAWGRGTEVEEALARYAEDDDDDDDDGNLEDLNLLARHAAPEMGVVDEEELKRRVDDWMTEMEEREGYKWYEFKLSLDTAVQCTYGIWQRGVVDLLTQKIDFDENGVYR